ncbi:MAG: exodeoxyribonuclease III [Planctomycetota bacterium]|nr:MAG: exodeoxyribonuclease III [Planctomycetota bacterium]
MRVASWNVNGLRACARKGFLDWLAGARAQVVCVQEVRALPEQLPHEVRAPRGWQVSFAPAERPGYAGVALYARDRPDAVETSLGEARFDAEGRLQLARFGRLWVANVYFPRGTGRGGNERVPFKLAFYRRLFRRLAPLLDEGERVLVVGDFNTAHREVDLARPRQNRRTSGFLPEERAEFDRWLAAGFVDTFRALHPDAAGVYTWWSQRGGARERNVGWRIDYALASPAAWPFVRAARVCAEVRGSDHCPILVDLDGAVLG